MSSTLDIELGIAGLSTPTTVFREFDWWELGISTDWWEVSEVAKLTAIAEVLKGYTPHFLNPAIKLAGITAFSHACEKKTVKIKFGNDPS